VCHNLKSDLHQQRANILLFISRRRLTVRRTGKQIASGHRSRFLMKAAAVCIEGCAVRPKAKQMSQPYHHAAAAARALSHTHKGHRITCWQRDMPRIQTRRIISNARGRVCVRCARCVPTERRMRLCFGTQKQSDSVRGTKSLSAFFRAVRAQFLHDNHHLQLPVEFICGMRGGSLRIHHVARRGIVQSGHVSMDQQNQSWCDLKSSLCGSRCGTSASLDDSPISHVSVISAIVTQLFYRRAH
jgi:hypothetical protein